MAGYTLTVDFDADADAVVASVSGKSEVIDSVSVGDSLNTQELRNAWYDMQVDETVSDYLIVTTFDQSVSAIEVHVFDKSTDAAGAIAQANIGQDLDSDKLYDSWIEFHEKD